MIESDELKSIALSTSLIVLNVAFMAVFALTPAKNFTDFVFQIPLVGVIIFGAMITGGVYLAKRGIQKDNSSTALGGTAILQVAYAIFGAGIIGFLPVATQAAALGITAVITTVIALLSGLLVYGTDHNFSSWRKYSNYMFMGVLLFALLGSLNLGVMTLIAFLLALGGFITYLVYEIWEMKQRPGKIYMNSIGIYVAFMGVFVQILQIVIEMYLEE